MSKKLKKDKNYWSRTHSKDYTLSAPPCHIYSTFQPGGFSRLYHRCEEVKMKRSHSWVYTKFEIEKIYKKKDPKKIQEDVPPIKTYIEEGILKVEIGEYEKETMKKTPMLSSTIEAGMIRVEIGTKDNKKIVYIDFKGYSNIII